MSSNRGIKVVISAVVVIGMILIGTGIIIIMMEPTDGNGATTTTSTIPHTEIGDNPYEIAIVFETGGLDDMNINDMVYSGAVHADSDYNINFTYAEPASVSEYETFLRGYAAHSGYNEAYNLIISVGFDQASAVMAVAKDYPEQQFAILDTYIDPIEYPNVASVLFTENEGSALVGAIAGMYTITGKVGFLGGMDIPLIRKYAAGYFWGANYTYWHYTNPGHNIATVAQYVGGWADIPTGKSLSLGMYTGGADIIFAAAGRSGLGAFEAVKETNATSFEKLWVIGADSPQMYLGCADPDNPAPPTLCLTSMLKRFDVTAYDLMYDAVIGTWSSGLKLYDLSDGGHDYEVKSDLLTLRPEVVGVVEMVRTGIINGTFVVPDDY